MLGIVNTVVGQGNWDRNKKKITITFSQKNNIIKKYLRGKDKQGSLAGTTLKHWHRLLFELVVQKII